MKKLALTILLIIITVSATVNIGAYDYYGKNMPDYLFNAEAITQIVSTGTSKAGMVYDSERVYVSYIPNLDESVPSDGTYAQAAFSAKVPATEYRYIKVGYKGYVASRTEAAKVDINIGIDGIRFWGASDQMTFDGVHREITVDAAMLTGGDDY
ncbi:MAG: hypothetical protein IJ391_08880, partial [Clostridia bacterium]|nr:hypothetical protein [Clostridia bacterium]